MSANTDILHKMREICGLPPAREPHGRVEESAWYAKEVEGEHKAQVEAVRRLPIAIWAERNPPHWQTQQIETWDDNRLQRLLPFVRSHFWSDRHSLNVFNVVGTAHPDYQGLSWIEFLAQGRRMRENQRLLQANPGYYFETTVKAPSMLYVSLNGKHWYVNGDGNHRTCLARFHFDRLATLGDAAQTMIHGVTVDDYRIDWATQRAFEGLRRHCEDGRLRRVEAGRMALGREDGPAWKVDRFEPWIEVEDKRGRTRRIGHLEAGIYLEEVRNRSGFLGGIFG